MQNVQAMAPSPGKSFLDASTGQEVFGTSIEEDNPMLKPVTTTDSIMSNGHSPMNSVYDTYDTALSGRKKAPTATALPQIIIPKPQREEAADKNIPTKLKPDKLLANEEFYEQLKDSMKDVESSRYFESTQEDPETYLKYKHHLGRAEFGTLKKRTSNRPSAATSRDPSGDRVNTGISRDTSGDRLGLASSSKQFLGSRDVHIRSDSRMSGASGGLPDLEYDENFVISRNQSGDRGVQRTTSLLDGTIKTETTGVGGSENDVLAKKEAVLRDLEDKKSQIKEAKAWIQNGLMTVVGVGVMAYLQTLESMGS